MGLLSKMDKMDLGILIAEEVCEKRVHEQNVNQLQKRVEELEKEVKDLTEHKDIEDHKDHCHQQVLLNI